MKVYQHVAALLARHGVTTMFGLLGDANMYVAGAFEDAGGTFVRVAHEASAVSMADAYARMSGTWSVATVTHGPGFTNTLTALVEAARFSTPVLLITGDPPPEPTHMQRLDIAAVCAAAGVAHERIHRPETAERDVHRALRTLRATGQPVVLNIPIPLSLSPACPDYHSDTTLLDFTPPITLADESGLDTALGLAASASRPVVVAGRGVIAAGAEADVAELADILGAALFTTGLGIGLFGSHPRHLGIMGSIAHPEATPILMDSDCVIAIGTSLNKYTSFGGELFSEKTLIHIDADPVKIGWFVAPTCGLVGDAAAVTRAMVEAIGHGELPEKKSWKQRSEQAHTDIAAWTPPDDQSDADTIDIRVATQRIDALLPPGITVVSDVGRFIAGSWPYLSAIGPGLFTAMTGFGAIGLGLAAGTGAALSRRSPMTVLLVGDGGFMMHASELSTAVREQIPMLIVVYNDGAYGAEYQKLLNEGLSAQHSYNQWPDIAVVARSFGAAAHTITNPADIDALRDAVIDLQGPLVLDVRLDPTHHLIF